MLYQLFQNSYVMAQFTVAPAFALSTNNQQWVYTRFHIFEENGELS